MSTMTYIWLVLAVVLFSLEAATAQLVSIWFIIGSLSALVASLFIDSVAIQIMVFVSFSITTLLFLRPFLKKVLAFKKEDVNLGRYIGKKALVLSQINNDLGMGEINVGGSVWAARSVDGSVIDKGETVLVESINGVKCNVKRLGTYED